MTDMNKLATPLRAEPVRIPDGPDDKIGTETGDADLIDANGDWLGTLPKETAALIVGIVEQNEKMREALADCQDLLQAIEDATGGIGRIDANSILRPGERLKTIARKLNSKAKAALAVGGE